MKIKASLESVKTRKNVTDDIVQTVVFNVYVTADQIGQLQTFYRQPIELEITLKSS